MWRTALGFLVLSILAYLAVDLIFTSSKERVEAIIEQVLERGRAGGEEAAAAILATLADDYDGEIPRRRLEYYLDNFVANGRIEKLSTGGYKIIVTGDDELLIPLLAIYATVEGHEIRAVMHVTFAERQGEWKVVNVARGWAQTR